MFTGIITDIGKVKRVEERPGGLRLTIATQYDTGAMGLGASVACCGPCLTVVDKGGDWFAVDVSAETLACTTLSGWKEGREVNLERALKMGDELGGHMVTGHVDAVAEITTFDPDGESVRMEVAIPEGLEKFIAEKGSVTLDGVALTVNEVGRHSFCVTIIPHTLEHTTFRHAGKGTKVNLEIDVLARYAVRLSLL